MTQLDHIPWLAAEKSRYPIHLLELQLTGTKNFGTLCVQRTQLLAQLTALVAQALLNEVVSAAFQRGAGAFCGGFTVRRFRHKSAPAQPRPNGRLLGCLVVQHGSCHQIGEPGFLHGLLSLANQ